MPQADTAVTDRMLRVMADVGVECKQSVEKHGRFNSLHEAAAVIREEHDELWEEIKARHPENEYVYEEAKQLAAMAVRLMYELPGLTDKSLSLRQNREQGAQAADES